MKKTIIIVQILLLNLILKAQEPPPAGNLELAVWNYTGYDIEVQLYPVSAVFNGELIPKYTLLAYGRDVPPSNDLSTSYINGTAFKSFYGTYTPQSIFTVYNNTFNGWDANCYQDGPMMVLLENLDLVFTNS